MTAVLTQSHLAANINSLGKRNADLGEKLASVLPHPEVVFGDSQQEVRTVVLDGRQLCSRHRPLDEAAALVQNIDLVEHAVVVVLGFGAGYHVRKLAERAAKATLIIVFEPDLALLRGVLDQIDHSDWMRDALLLFVTDPDDRASLAAKLDGAESILAQGVHFLEHPPSRARLGAASAQFTRLFSDFITTAKTTLLTTLMRSVDTVRNLLCNIDHYAVGENIADLHNRAAGFPAVVVSAGPSLHKNVHLLKQPGVRDRCVIVAVQTTLKPLLEAGIKPHFVTALDYHEISGRFYEGLKSDDVRDVTLIADPKAHPIILDSFPGPIRCCANGFLDKLLGPQARAMGTLPAGATVAHLAFYVAKYLGCNPIAMIGQDLAFTDGLYYAPGAAIHDIWAPELNPFNTIEMMEWQRIVRHRLHLHKTRDVHGRSIYTDAQMQTYRQQFEREFAQYAREGLTIVDATEGGAAKQHTIAMPLARFLADHSRESLPHLPTPLVKSDEKRSRQVSRRLADICVEIQTLRDISKDTSALLRRMLDDQLDQTKMARHFERIEKNRREVERRLEPLEMINQLNQLGVFKRLKADRRLHMTRGLDPLKRQRHELERDLENVNWIADAAQELIEQLEVSKRLLAGEQVSAKPRTTPDLVSVDDHKSAAPPSRIAALVPVDPNRNGLGTPRSLNVVFNGQTVLQATLERLGNSRRIESIILIVPRDLNVESLISPSRIGIPIEFEHCTGSPFGPEQEAVAAARLWSDTCWRGGISGMSIYDEILCPQIMHEIIQRRGLTAALLVGPDWPLVNVTGEGGCDAVIARHQEHPQQHNLVFTQSPPGLCGCVVSASLMKDLSQRNRLSTIGGLLVYQPHAPQHDPIARDANVQIDHLVRRSLIRATFDSPQQCELIRQAICIDQHDSHEPVKIVAALETACGLAHTPPSLFPLPKHLTLELCTARTSTGIFARHPSGPINRPPLTLELAERIFAQFKDSPETALTLAGAGDPLLHPQFDEIIMIAKRHGIRVNVRTELLCDRIILDRLLNSGVDVVSVALNADRAATYLAMMGVDRFKDVLLNIDYLVKNRRRLTSQPGMAAFAMPWIVPHLQRRAETYEDIDSFFDRWQHTLGTAVIDGPPPFDVTDTLAPAVTPPRVTQHENTRHMTIFSDGSAPIDGWDWPCKRSAGSVSDTAIAKVWQDVLQQRSA